MRNKRCLLRFLVSYTVFIIIKVIPNQEMYNVILGYRNQCLLLVDKGELDNCCILSNGAKRILNKYANKLQDKMIKRNIEHNKINSLYN